MSEMLFHPPCLSCLGRLPDVMSTGLPLQGGNFECGNCKERFSYMINNDRLTLKRISVPMGYNLPTEWTVAENVTRDTLVSKTMLQVLLNDLSWKSPAKLIRDFETQPQVAYVVARSRFSRMPPFRKTRMYLREELQFLIPFLKEIVIQGGKNTQDNRH